MKPAGFLLLAVLNGLLATPSSGQTWLTTGAPVIRTNGDLIFWDSIAVSADGNKVLAADSIYGPLCSSTNAGTTWDLITAPVTNGFVVMSADGFKWMILGSNSYVSTNDGAAWTSFIGRKGVAAASADLATLYVEDNSGTLYLSTNSGVTWTWTVLPIADGASLACSADGRKVYAVNHADFPGGGGVSCSTNAGQTWNSPALDAPFGFYAAACSTNGNRVVLVGRSRIFVSTNAGATWVRLTNAPNHIYTAVACSPDGTHVAALSTTSMIFVGNAACFSSDFGATWITNSVVDREWLSVVNSANGSRWFAGDWDGGLWTLGTNLDPVLKIKSKDLTLTWPVASTNFVLQSSSNLATWMNVTNRTVLNWSNLQYEVTVPATNQRGFYRLKSP